MNTVRPTTPTKKTTVQSGVRQVSDSRAQILLTQFFCISWFLYEKNLLIIPLKVYKNIDTDHPAFQIAAPEFSEAPEDVLAERLVLRWKRVQDLSRSQAIAIVKEEYIKLQIERDGRYGMDHYSYAKGISAVLAHIADSATPMVELDAVAYCYGLIGRAEESMDDIAKRHKISKQAFSKKVEKILDSFHLKPQYGMRPQPQRKVYKSVHLAKWENIEQDAPKS